MSKATQKTSFSPQEDQDVWVSKDGEHYFLIPVDYQFATGDFEIYHTTGRGVNTDLATIKPFNVSKADAKVYFKHHLEESFLEAIDITKDLLNNPEGKVALTKPEDIQEFWLALDSLLTGVMGDNPAVKKEAKVYFDGLYRILAEEGIVTEQDLSTLPKVVQSWYQTLADEESLQTLERELLVFAKEINKNPQEFGREVDRAINALEKQLGKNAPTMPDEKP